ncbi:MAG TPA: translation initiation factor IF-3 [Patescibacteria group bacterium]
MNERINSPEVFLIGPKGEPFGVVSNDQAQFLAFDANIDLVEINPNRVPPIVKMMDYGKYRYEIEKKQRESKVKAKASELKEVRLTRKIDKHDLETKAKRAKDWLEHGDKVRVYLQLMGREYMFADAARETINHFRELIDGVFEQAPNQMGNRIIAIIRKK